MMEMENKLYTLYIMECILNLFNSDILFWLVTDNGEMMSMSYETIVLENNLTTCKRCAD